LTLDEFKTLADAGDWPKLNGVVCRHCATVADRRGRRDRACANTLHLMVPELEQLVQIPYIHIADATVGELSSQDIRKTALLGINSRWKQHF